MVLRTTIMSMTLPLFAPESQILEPSRRGKDGKNVSALSDDAWRQMDRAAKCFGHPNRATFMETFFTVVTPLLERPVPYDDLARAFREVAQESKRGVFQRLTSAAAREDCCSGFQAPTLDEGEVARHKRLGLSDSAWLEMKRASTLLGFERKIDFLDKFATDILPEFTDFSSLSDLALVAIRLNDSASVAL
jgi:hypothetical protein